MRHFLQTCSTNIFLAFISIYAILVFCRISNSQPRVALYRYFYRRRRRRHCRPKIPQRYDLIWIYDNRSFRGESVTEDTRISCLNSCATSFYYFIIFEIIPF